MSGFNWNWQPTPIELSPVDPRRKEAAAAMQDLLVFGTELPFALGGEGGIQRGVGDRNTANLYAPGLGLAYNEREALMSEYRANEEKIKILEAKVKTVTDAWDKGNAGRERAALDEMDRQLALSRAKYGDFSGAYGHLNRIDSRALAAMSKEDSAETKKEKLNKIVGELEAAYIMRNSGDATTQADWNNKIRRLLVEYKDLAGKDYVYDGSSPDTTNYGEGDEVKDIMAYDSKLSNLKTLRTDGRITDAQFNELWSDLKRLPNGPEKDKRREELFELGKNSVEKAAKKSAEYTAKVNKAVDELIKGERKFSTEDKKALKKEGGSATVTRSGVEMTVKYTGIRDGKKSYEVYVNGKRKGSYQE